MRTFKELEIGETVYSRLLDMENLDLDCEMTEWKVCEKETDEGVKRCLNRFDGSKEVEDGHFDFGQSGDESVDEYYVNDGEIIIYAVDEEMMKSYVREYMRRLVRRTQEMIDEYEDRKWKLTEMINTI